MMSAAFPGHPGGMPHPGMAHGQPMGPGQVHHPGQMLGHPMGMQTGVTGAGPHVSQAGPMMGMQHGMGGPGGPSAHAMSHLAPNAQVIQGHAMMNNPMAQQQMQQRAVAQQQAMLRQQQQMQSQMHPQGQMPMGFPGGMNMQMNPQQMNAMQGVNLPPHIQQQMQLRQQMAAAQAQAQAHAQAQAQQHQHQQNLAAAQQQQAQQQHAAQQQHQAAQQAQHAQAQHLAMQHATSQSSNQGHSTPGPQSQPAPPNRPPTAMGGPHTAHASPAQQPPEQQQSVQQQQQPVTQQGRPQQPTATSAPQLPAQAANGTQQNQQDTQGQPGPQNAAQASQAPGAAQSQANQGPGGLQAQTAQQAQANAAKAQVLATQQTANRLLQQKQQQAAMGRDVLLKVFSFADKLSSFRAEQQQNDISYWRKFVAQHFTEEGVFRLILQAMSGGQRKGGKQFDLSATLLPRYFWTQYDDSVVQIQLILEGINERPVNNTSHYVQADGARMVYWFKDGTQLVWSGELQVVYLEDKIDTLTFKTREHQHFIPRDKLEELCALASPDQSKSPKLTKKAAPKQKQPPPKPSFNPRFLPDLPVTEFGVPPRVQQVLETSETFGFMKDMMYFAQDNPKLQVREALGQLVQNYRSRAQAGQTQGNAAQSMGMGPNATNPALQQMQQGNRTPATFMSPAMQNSLLPGGVQANGSPHLGGNSMIGNTHTPSPAQSHMAPPMVPQHSQQGSASSANTSPNTSNKRRRSTVAGLKEEGDDGGGQANGTGPKVKPSPRMGANTAKRLKGN